MEADEKPVRETELTVRLKYRYHTSTHEEVNALLAKPSTVPEVVAAIQEVARMQAERDGMDTGVTVAAEIIDGPHHR